MLPLALPQPKTRLWQLSMLWLIAFSSAIAIALVLFILLTFIPLRLPSVTALVVFFLSYGAGAYFAARYVLRRSMIRKTEALKVALWLILPPLCIIVGLMLFSLSRLLLAGGQLDIPSFLLRLLEISVGFGALTFALRAYIKAKGD